MRETDHLPLSLTLKGETMQTYKEILVEAKEEIKVIWKDAWEEYKVVLANARTEVEFEERQKAIDILAIHAQLEIDELNINYHNFYK